MFAIISDLWFCVFICHVFLSLIYPPVPMVFYWIGRIFLFFFPSSSCWGVTETSIFFSVDTLTFLTHALFSHDIDCVTYPHVCLVPPTLSSFSRISAQDQLHTDSQEHRAGKWGGEWKFRSPMGLVWAVPGVEGLQPLWESTAPGRSSVRQSSWAPSMTLIPSLPLLTQHLAL